MIFKKNKELIGWNLIQRLTSLIQRLTKRLKETRDPCASSWLVEVSWKKQALLEEQYKAEAAPCL
jgi:hypothetical protein